MREKRNKMIFSLYEYLGILPVPQDRIPTKPEYPYVTYKFIVPYNQFEHQGNYINELVPSDNHLFEYDIEERLELQPQMTLSINVYCKGKGDDQMIAYETAKKAMDWFKHTGYQILSDMNVVVVDITAFGDRSILITDSFEVRYGFDVIMRTTDTIKRRIANIEEYSIKEVL